MELRITRLPFDERSYSVDAGTGSRYVKAADLKKWLFDLGIGDSTVAAVLDMSPSETMTVKAREEEAA